MTSEIQVNSWHFHPNFDSNKLSNQLPKTNFPLKELTVDVPMLSKVTISKDCLQLEIFDCYLIKSYSSKFNKITPKQKQQNSNVISEACQDTNSKTSEIHWILGYGKNTWHIKIKEECFTVEERYESSDWLLKDLLYIQKMYIEHKKVILNCWPQPICCFIDNFCFSLRFFCIVECGIVRKWGFCELSRFFSQLY